MSLNVTLIMVDVPRSSLYWIASTVRPLIEFDIQTHTMSTLTSKQASNGVPNGNAGFIYWARNTLELLASCD